MKSLEFDKLLSADSCAADRYDYLRRQSPDGRVYVQEKKNGVGVRIKIREGSKLEVTTRHSKAYKINYFNDIRWEPLWTFTDCVFHAEIYTTQPDVPLATLAGGVSVNRDMPDKEIMQHVRFYVYDYEELSGQAVPFKRRQQNLRNLVGLTGSLHIHIAQTITIDTTDGLLAHWRAEVTNNGKPPEGFIYRVDPCFHHDGGATYMQVKRTVLHTAEGTCIGVEEGIGKRIGMLGSFRLQLASGHVVSVGGGDGLTDVELVRYFKHPPIGKPITFSYKELSKAGIPLRVQFVSVRDYE